MADQPGVVCVFSGKRKSGKDYVVEKLRDIVGAEHCEVVRLSGPLKHEYSRIHGLDFDQLLDSSSYKEKYRKDMIKWGEDKRNNDPSYFCGLASKMAYREDVTKPAWLVSDARRVSDLEYFRTNYPHIFHVRVEASESVRETRGWTFTAGVDDAESECGLDNARFDIVIRNDGDDNQLMIALSSLHVQIRCLMTS